MNDAPFWLLATCAEGVPNVVPVGYKWVENDKLLLADLFFGKTRRNLAANSLVAVTVASVDPKRGFQVKGTASVHRAGEPYQRLCTCLRGCGVDTDPHAAVLITVTHVYQLAPGPNAGSMVIPQTNVAVSAAAETAAEKKGDSKQ